MDFGASLKLLISAAVESGLIYRNNLEFFQKTHYLFHTLSLSLLLSLSSSSSPLSHLSPLLSLSLSLSSHSHSHHNLTLTLTHPHTHVGFFYGLRGLSIGVMVFILYKLYVLLPYTYPTPKLSPHRRRCISIFPQKKLTLYDL